MAALWNSVAIFGLFMVDKGETMKMMMGIALAAVLVTGVGTASAAEVGSHALKAGVNVEAGYPSFGHDIIDTRIRDWLEAILADAVRNMTEVVVSPDIDDFTSEVQVGYRLVQASERMATVVFSTYTYPARAAHGLTRIDTLNFDLDDGEMATFEDCFDRPEEALEIMSSNARRLVNENFEKNVSGELADVLADDGWFSEGFAPTRDNFAAFIVEPGGMRIVFQQYQVLPYVFGLPEAFFPLELLASAGPRLEYWGEEGGGSVDDGGESSADK